MITDVVYHISRYMSDVDYILYFGTVNNELFEPRRRMINRKRVANSLTVRILDTLGISLDDDISYFKTLLNESDGYFTFQDLLMYVANGLLEKNSSTFSYTYNYSKHRKMKYTYVTRGSFYGGLKINNQYTKKIDKPVCAVYRLPIAKKKYLNKLNPIVKALIY
jgi:hypothetical protein